MLAREVRTYQFFQIITFGCTHTHLLSLSNHQVDTASGDHRPDTPRRRIIKYAVSWTETLLSFAIANISLLPHLQISHSTGASILSIHRLQTNYMARSCILPLPRTRMVSWTENFTTMHMLSFANIWLLFHFISPSTAELSSCQSIVNTLQHGTLLLPHSHIITFGGDLRVKDYVVWLWWGSCTWMWLKVWCRLKA